MEDLRVKANLINDKYTHTAENSKKFQTAEKDLKK